jgi:4a-hydroxytetrahydrobiopterin dehydratase
MSNGDRARPSTKLLALAAMACREGAPRLGADELAAHLAALPAWSLEGDRIEKTFQFANYYETIAFVNALAWVSHRADHHPDLGVHYNRCVVTYSTHSAGGVTLNDVICAAQAERLIAGPA